MLNVLYIGPNDSEWAQMNRPVSLAAAKWSRGFLTALSKIANVTVLTHTYEVSWPKGKVLWRGYDKRLYPDGWDCVSISYPVIKYIRDWWYAWRYPKEARKIAVRKKIDAAIFYNCHLPYLVRTIKVLHSMGVPCFPIILDGDDPRKDDWGWMKRAGRYSSGIVSLSWWVHTHCPVAVPKYHMDGGADGWEGGEGSGCLGGSGCSEDSPHPTPSKPSKLSKPSNKPSKPPKPSKPSKLVHTGALDQWRGLDFMIEVVKRMASHDVRFVFCGKSSCKVLEKIFGDNPYVELLGFVEEDEMNRICRDADVLLNVRDPLHPDNILNYPSKLPHYLSFGRPVVSTRLESLSPDYAEVVELAEGDTVDDYVAKVREVLAWDEERKRAKFEMIKKWFLARKQWGVLVGGMYNWMEGIVNGQ